MAQKLYRVVETVWKAGGRESRDIGSAWKTERLARDEMKALAAKQPAKLFSLEAKK